MPPKYDIGFVIHTCTYETLYELEPWCSDIYVDSPIIEGYIEQEQPDTDFNLKKKVHSQHMNPQNDIVVHIDCSKLNQKNYPMLCQLPEILEQQGEIGEFELDVFTVKVKNLNTYEKELIVCKTK